MSLFVAQPTYVLLTLWAFQRIREWLCQFRWRPCWKSAFAAVATCALVGHVNEQHCSIWELEQLKQTQMFGHQNPWPRNWFFFFQTSANFTRSLALHKTYISGSIDGEYNTSWWYAPVRSPTSELRCFNSWNNSTVQWPPRCTTMCPLGNSGFQVSRIVCVLLVCWWTLALLWRLFCL